MTMKNCSYNTTAFLMLLATLLASTMVPRVQGFMPHQGYQQQCQLRRPTLSLEAVKDIKNEGDFDKTIKAAGSALVVIDYSTTWCGPCKVIAPKFDELSEKYSDAVFCKVIGDASPEASKLMKREGVRSVPSFHYFVNGEKIDVVNGANAEAIEAAITKHIHTAA
jgi:thioredoxin 1